MAFPNYHVYPVIPSKETLSHSTIRDGVCESQYSAAPLAKRCLSPHSRGRDSVYPGCDDAIADARRKCALVGEATCQALASGAGHNPLLRNKKERLMGFEPTTTCLGSKDSTTELQPPYHR